MKSSVHVRSLSALALLVLSSGQPLYAAEQPQQGGTLTWGVETEPNTLNPQLNGQSKAELILRVAYESLLARKPDGSYIPWLATGYNVSDDGKTYTFTLRDDVKFSMEKNSMPPPSPQTSVMHKIRRIAQGRVFVRWPGESPASLRRMHTPSALR